MSKTKDNCIFLERGMYGQGYYNPDFCWFFAHEVDSCTDQCPGFVEKIRALNELAVELKMKLITKNERDIE